MTTWLLPSVLSQRKAFFFSLFLFFMSLNGSPHFKINLKQGTIVWPWDSFNHFIPTKIVLFFWKPKLIANRLYLSYQTTHDPNEVYFSSAGPPYLISPFFTARRQFNTYDFSRGTTLKPRWNHHGKMAAKAEWWYKGRMRLSGESRFPGWRDEATASI